MNPGCLGTSLPKEIAGIGQQGCCVTTSPLPVLFPEPALHDFLLETDQVSEFDRRHASVAEVADLANAASDVSGHVIGSPEGIGRWLSGWVGLWGGG